MREGRKIVVRGIAGFWLQGMVMHYNGGHPVNFSQGLHIVMLENYFDIDPNKTQDQINRGAYVTRGSDRFKGYYYVVVDGKVKNRGYGSSRSSLAPLHNENAYRDLRPGEYPVHGELVESHPGKYAMRLLRERAQMNSFYAGGKSSSTLVPAQYVGGPQAGEFTTQQKILLHWYTSATGANSNWSGGVGCQLFQSLKTWLQNTYGNNLENVSGRYYLVDIQRPDVYQSLQERSE